MPASAIVAEMCDNGAAPIVAKHNGYDYRIDGFALQHFVNVCCADATGKKGFWSLAVHVSMRREIKTMPVAVSLVH